VPEWQIITKTGLLPTVAFWGAINVVLLFLVCMMSLQAPLRRAGRKISARGADLALQRLERFSPVRLTDRFLSVHFDLPACVERDLLIRKLFTGGLDATTVTASGWSATRAMLGSIWSNRTALPAAAPVSAPAPETVVAVTTPVKLPARSFVMAPQPRRARLAELSAERRKLAA
jgi:cellulose synthase (UDP-forming)